VRALIDNNTAYQKVTFVIADWDTYRKAPTAAIEALFKAVI